MYLREICGREEGAPPPVNLAAEKRNGDAVRALIGGGKATAVHDVSDGGLLVAIAEMAMASGIGATLTAAPAPAHAFWFGEDQARYLVTAPAAQADAVIAALKKAGVAAARIGATGGKALTLPGEQPMPVATLRERFEGWLPAYMAQAV
jgi:phosphoribosylformylglycinamidine synthase subunit PurL